MGVKRFATLNDGTFFSPLNSRKKNAAKLRKTKQAFSRKCKRSNNCKKAKARVGRIENRIANARKDYLHKLSTQLCKTHAAICVEDLKVKNLSRSAKGSVEKPGRNVKAKSKLNHAILDQGWGEFRRQLAYKTEWERRHLRRCAASQHQPYLPVLRTRLRPQPTQSSAVPVRQLRL